MMSSCLLGLAALAVSCAAAGCSTVEPGSQLAIAPIAFDENYFYCKVEPVLMAKSCGAGDPALGDTGSCHASVTHFRLDTSATTPVPCDNLTPTAAVPISSQTNYQAAQGEMTLDPDTAPLFTHPTQKTSHPRQIFTPDSTEAGIIRDWATRYASH
jgi:hypothetical protein